jgi:hypothetical protein
MKVKDSLHEVMAERWRMQLHVEQLAIFHRGQVPCEGRDFVVTLKAILVQFGSVVVQELVDYRGWCYWAGSWRRMD